MGKDRQITLEIGDIGKTFPHGADRAHYAGRSTWEAHEFGFNGTHTR